MVHYKEYGRLGEDLENQGFHAQRNISERLEESTQSEAEAKIR